MQHAFDGVAAFECRQRYSDGGRVGPMLIVSRERWDARMSHPGSSEADAFLVDQVIALEC